MKYLSYCFSALLFVSTNVLAEVEERITTMEFDNLKIHTFYGVSNSHVLETENELRLVDAQMTLSDAKELKGFMDTLNKPLKQVLLSHNHPDHWFGAEVFAKEAPIVTSDKVAEDLEKGGMRYIKILKKRLKDDMPTEVIKAEGSLALGKHTWDGLEVVVEAYYDHESHSSIVIKIPQHGVMIGQDLFYNEKFLVASDRKRNQNWIEILEKFKETETKNYPIILVGHGKNTDPSIFQQNIDYLTALEATLAKGLSKEETEKAMVEQFPNKTGKGLLGISMRNLFSDHH